MKITEDDKFSYYVSLLDYTYEECIQLLKEKYGEVRDNYFKEQSYYRFRRGEIKQPAPGKYSRFDEGLVCHHVREDIAMSLSSPKMLVYHIEPYEYQKKENLVYCDLWEHAILHVIIIAEAKMIEFNGYTTNLRPTIMKYYIKNDENTKIAKTRQAYIDRANIGLANSEKLVAILDQFIVDHESEALKAKKLAERLEAERIIAEEKQRIYDEKQIVFEKSYPYLGKIGIDHTTPRKKLVKLLYSLNQINDMTFKEYYSSTLTALRDTMLAELNVYAEAIPATKVSIKE